MELWASSTIKSYYQPQPAKEQVFKNRKRGRGIKNMNWRTDMTNKFLIIRIMREHLVSSETSI